MEVTLKETERIDDLQLKGLKLIQVNNIREAIKAVFGE